MPKAFPLFPGEDLGCVTKQAGIFMTQSQKMALLEGTPLCHKPMLHFLRTVFLGSGLESSLVDLNPMDLCLIN